MNCTVFSRMACVLVLATAGAERSQAEATGADGVDPGAMTDLRVYQRQRAIRVLFPRLRSCLEAERWHEAAALLAEIRKASPSPEMDHLIRQFPALPGMNGTLGPDTTAVTARAAHALRSAHRAADLDRTVHDLARSRLAADTSGPSGGAMDFAWISLESVERFVLRWQDALGALEGNDPKEAEFALDDLQEAAVPLDFMPRSEILSHLRRLRGELRGLTVQGRTEAIMARVQAPEDMARGVRDLMDLVARDEPGEAMDHARSLLHVLSGYEIAYQDHRSGSASSIDNLPTHSDPVASAWLAGLEAGLQRVMLPRYWYRPGLVPARPGERIPEFARRFADEAVRRGEPELAIRAMAYTGAEQLAMDDAAAARAYRVARNMAEARQPFMAAAYYHLALREGSPVVSSEDVGFRLGMIERDHPEDAARALDWVLDLRNRGIVLLPWHVRRSATVPFSRSLPSILEGGSSPLDPAEPFHTNPARNAVLGVPPDARRPAVLPERPPTPNRAD